VPLVPRETESMSASPYVDSNVSPSGTHCEYFWSTWTTDSPVTGVGVGVGVGVGLGLGVGVGLDVGVVVDDCVGSP